MQDMKSPGDATPMLKKCNLTAHGRNAVLPAPPTLTARNLTSSEGFVPTTDNPLPSLTKKMCWICSGFVAVAAGASGKDLLMDPLITVAEAGRGQQK
jgi:hypothetical protein